MYDATTTPRPLLVCMVMAALSAACSAALPAAPSEATAGTSATRLSFINEPAGTARTYTLQNATFRALSLRSGGALDISIRPSDPGDKSGPWTLMIGSPSGIGLSPGTYPTSPFDTDSGYGFLLLGNDDSFCDGRAGSVTIREIDITPSALRALRASFTIQCMRGGTVRGEIAAIADPWR